MDSLGCIITVFVTACVACFFFVMFWFVVIGAIVLLSKVILWMAYLGGMILLLAIGCWFLAKACDNIRSLFR